MELGWIQKHPSDRLNAAARGRETILIYDVNRKGNSLGGSNETNALAMSVYERSDLPDIVRMRSQEVKVPADGHFQQVATQSGRDTHTHECARCGLSHLTGQLAVAIKIKSHPVASDSLVAIATTIIIIASES